MDKVSLLPKFELFNDYWSPKIAGELNGQQVKLAKFLGSFPWHHHDHEDEFFLVIKGSFAMELKDKLIPLNEGDFLIVPKGVEHRPVAEHEAWVMMFEPAGTLNTGNTESEYTRRDLECI